MKHGTRDPEISQKITYLIMSENLGFTPAEVDSMSATEVESYLEMISEKKRLEADAIKKAGKHGRFNS